MLPRWLSAALLAGGANQLWQGPEFQVAAAAHLTLPQLKGTLIVMSPAGSAYSKAKFGPFLSSVFLSCSPLLLEQVFAVLVRPHLKTSLFLLSSFRAGSVLQRDWIAAALW